MYPEGLIAKSCSFAAWKQNSYVHLREEADAPILMHVEFAVLLNSYFPSL